MSLFCPRSACKNIKGACNCEKIMGVIALVIVVAVVGKWIGWF